MQRERGERERKKVHSSHPFTGARSLEECGKQSRVSTFPDLSELLDVELSLPNTAGSRLHPTLQLGGGSPALARSLQRARRCTASLLGAENWERLAGGPASCPTLQGEDGEENSGEELLDRRGNTLHTVPLSIEVLVKRAGRPGPQLEGRRVP